MEIHRKADAIVVLGAAIGRDGMASDALARRIRHGIALFEAGAAPRLILCGGDSSRAGVSEAAVMRDVALAAGVPTTAILLDERSASTFDNAKETAQLMRAHALATVILVSEGYHLRRARALFRLHGVNVAAVSAAPPGRVGYRIAMTLRELLTLPANFCRLIAHKRQRHRV
jgi:uncharacterized SAM-binding protein YcdF (DUF218 family)